MVQINLKVGQKLNFLILLKNHLASVNIEFQMGDELAIAAVEKAGGRFTASYYDRGSIQAAVNPVDYFLKGEPVRKRQLPPGKRSHILSILKTA